MKLIAACADSIPATGQFLRKNGCNKKIGLPGGDRTPDPQLRRLLLYPTELRTVMYRTRQNAPQTGECEAFRKMVGVQGFEPWTPWSQTRCATRLRHTPNDGIINEVWAGFSSKKDDFLLSETPAVACRYLSAGKSSHLALGAHRECARHGWPADARGRFQSCRQHRRAPRAIKLCRPARR